MCDRRLEQEIGRAGRQLRSRRSLARGGARRLFAGHDRSSAPSARLSRTAGHRPAGLARRSSRPEIPGGPRRRSRTDRRGKRIRRAAGGAGARRSSDGPCGWCCRSRCNRSRRMDDLQAGSGRRRQHRRAAVRQPQRRSGAKLFLRRNRRRASQRTVANPGPFGRGADVVGIGSRHGRQDRGAQAPRRQHPDRQRAALAGHATDRRATDRRRRRYRALVGSV